MIWDSIFRGFPIGSLVVTDPLVTQKRVPGKVEATEGNGWKGVAITTKHLLDGQQRCNAIALGFIDTSLGKIEKTKFFGLI